MGTPGTVAIPSQSKDAHFCSIGPVGLFGDLDALFCFRGRNPGWENIAFY
jgi:hypothetical protein